MKDGQVLILGGNLGGGNQNIAEIIHSGASSDEVVSSLVSFDGSEAELPPLALHQTVLIKNTGDSYLFLVAGGVGINANLDGVATFIPPYLQGPHLYLVDITGSQGSYTGRAAKKTNNFGNERLQRAFHSLTALGGNLFLLGGGYSTFLQNNSLTLCDDGVAKTGCYLADTLLIEAGGSTFEGLTFKESSTNKSLTFSSARFGHRVNVLPDGTAIVTGGLKDLPPKGIPTGLLENAEIFNPLRSSDSDKCKLQAAPE
ncbi:MAG TPA: hypothetical protein EYN66_20475 [Myxococcales bacterium]|nr:hypothetical protein [Myxococcales bacterium]